MKETNWRSAHTHTLHMQLVINNFSKYEAELEGFFFFIKSLRVPITSVDDQLSTFSIEILLLLF